LPPWATGIAARRAFRLSQNIHQPTLVVSGNHDVIVYTVNSLHLVQNLPNARLILYPDSNHGSWYQNHEEIRLRGRIVFSIRKLRSRNTNNTFAETGPVHVSKDCDYENDRQHNLYHRRGLRNRPGPRRGIPQTRQPGHHLGRRKSALDETTKANPGMASIELDLENLASIKRLPSNSQRRTQHECPHQQCRHYAANTAADTQDDAQLVATVTTNLIGPLRVTSALIDHLKAQSSATIVYNTSVLAFVPMAATSVYSATKAAASLLRSVSQRYQAAELLGKSSRTGSALGEN